MKFTLENTFHGTTATVILPEEGGVLTSAQQRRAEKSLCGMSDCCCGTVVPGDRQDCVFREVVRNDGSFRWKIRPRKK